MSRCGQGSHRHIAVLTFQTTSNSKNTKTWLKWRHLVHNIVTTSPPTHPGPRSDPGWRRPPPSCLSHSLPSPLPRSPLHLPPPLEWLWCRASSYNHHHTTPNMSPMSIFISATYTSFPHTVLNLLQQKMPGVTMSKQTARQFHKCGGHFESLKDPAARQLDRSACYGCHSLLFLGARSFCRQVYVWHGTLPLALVCRSQLCDPLPVVVVADHMVVVAFSQGSKHCSSQGTWLVIMVL